jgi:hypothetical protein
MAELDRSEKRLRRAPDYGGMLARRMLLTDMSLPKKHEPRSVKRVLAELPPADDTLDVDRHNLALLSNADLWETLRRSSVERRTRHVCLRGWRPIKSATGSNSPDRLLRSLSLSVGSTLETADLSESLITDAMLEVFTARLEKLRQLNLSGCGLLTNMGVRCATTSCGGSLTSLDLSRCPRITGEAIAWIVGSIGFTGGCPYLESLNLAWSQGLDDRGLEQLRTGGCSRLRFLSLQGCTKVTDVGLGALSRGCRELAVLNLEALALVKDAGVLMLAANCPKLVSLNLARVGAGKLTDRSVHALAAGCPCLQSLSFAGQHLLTEAGLCVLASKCPGLTALNITGCLEVTVDGVRALAEGLGHLSGGAVVPARAYFGLAPVVDAVSVRVEAAQMGVEGRAAATIQRTWREQRRAQRAAEDLVAADQNEAAYLIQGAHSRHKKRAAARVAARERAWSEGALMIQKCYRGHRVRLEAAELRKHRALQRANAHRAVPLQALFRSHFVRRQDTVVASALVELRRSRMEELREAAAVRSGAAIRAAVARRRCQALGELRRQQWRDRAIAARALQRAARAYIARAVMRRIRLEAEMERDLEAQAATRIQTFWRGCLGKHNGALARKELERMQRARHRSALRLQACFRGFQGREEAESRRVTLWRAGAAAVRIQAAFRRSRVLPWRRVRASAVALYVLQRQEMEYQDGLTGVELQDRHRIEAARHDSCSEDEEEEERREAAGLPPSDDARIHAAWEEVTDNATGRSYWWNGVLEQAAERRPHARELALLGARVRVYWPLEGQGFEGRVARFNRRRGKHRIDYKDGDHEWMALDEEEDRVVMEREGAWVQLRSFVDPDELEGRRREAAFASRRRQAQQYIDEDVQRWDRVWDDGAQLMRWLDRKSGSTFYARPDADSWTLDMDDMAEVCFVNSITGEVVYGDDPRLDDPEAEAKQLRREEIFADMRYASYFCSELSERFAQVQEGGQGGRPWRMLLQEAAEGKQATRLAAVLSAARGAFHKREFETNAELANAAELVRYTNSLRDWSHAELAAMEAQQSQARAGVLRAVADTST